MDGHSMSEASPAVGTGAREAATTRTEASQYDCLPCRLMGVSSRTITPWVKTDAVATGSAVFTGLGVFSYVSGRAQLRQQQAQLLRSGSRVGFAARRFGILSLSATMIGLGMYRLVN